MDWKAASGQFADLTAELAAIAEDLDYVKAFWIHGSRTAGRADEQSGIDYAFLIDDRRRYNDLKLACSRHIRWQNSPGFYPEQQWEVAVWKRGGESFNEIGWHIFTPEDLEPYERLFSDKHVPYKGERWVEPFMETHFLRYQSGAQYFFVNALPIHDPDGIVEHVQERLRFPEKVGGGVKNWALMRLRNRLPWHGNPWIIRDKYQFLVDIREDLYYIAIAHYARNERFLQDRLKHYEKDLEELKPDLRGLLDRLLAFDEEDKRPVMTEIIEELNKE